MSDVSQQEVEALLVWMHEPDVAERFTLADLLDWVNRRPLATALKLAAGASAVPSPHAKAEDA